MKAAPAALFAFLVAALVWASWVAFRPAAPARAAIVPAASHDPEAELARARAARRSDAVLQAITGALLDAGVTRGDVRDESTGSAGPSGFVRTTLAVDVPGSADGVAEAIMKKVSPLDGAIAEKTLAAGNAHVAVRLDGVDVASVDLFAAPIPLPPPELAGRPRVAIVVDDIGYAKPPVEKLLGISKNLTFSVIPSAPYAPELAAQVHAKGAEVMLHLPMEPEGRPNGFSKDGMLLHDMPAAILKQKVDDALMRVPFADGVNNHMGSLLTANADAMTAVMEELATRDVFFLDSRTSPQTVAYRIARAKGLRAMERDVFLDDVAEIGPILKQFDELEARAKKNGHAVAIGHPYPATIAAIQQAVPTLIDRGFEIVPARDLAAAVAPAAPAEAAAALTPGDPSGTQ